MARKTLIRSQTHPYHVTGRSNNRENFYCPLHSTWNIFNRNLAEVSSEYGAKIHAFVLMPNHYHLLITTPDRDLGDIMKKMISSVTKTMNFKSGRSGRVFGSRYHWSIINTDHYFDYALKYVYRNPAKAQLVQRVEDYQYSSLASLLGNGNLQFTLHPPAGARTIIPFEKVDPFLTWLNQPFRKEHDEMISKGLRKAEFVPPLKNWKRQKYDFPKSF